MQSVSGLYDYGLRFYSPGLGRFINRDPSGEAGGLNLYAAFANNPLSFVDEYGLNISSLASAFGQGVRDGAFGVEGAKAFVEAAIVGAATAFLMGSCCFMVPLLTMAIGLVGAAVGIAGLLQAVSEILYSDLCPDEKASQLGRMEGGLGNAWFGCCDVCSKSAASCRCAKLIMSQNSLGVHCTSGRTGIQIKLHFVKSEGPEHNGMIESFDGEMLDKHLNL